MNVPVCFQTLEFGHFAKKYLLSYTGDPSEVVIPSNVGNILPSVFEGKSLLQLSVPDKLFDHAENLQSETVQTLIVRMESGQDEFVLSLRTVLKGMPSLKHLHVESSVPVGMRSYGIENYPDFPFTFSGNVDRFALFCKYSNRDGILPRFCFPAMSPGRMQKELRCSLIGSYLEDDSLYTQEQKDIYETWLRRNGTEFFTQAIQNGFGALLETYMARLDRMPFRPVTFDKWIQAADEKGNTVLKAALLDRKARQFDLQRLSDEQEKRENWLLEHPESAKALRRTWKWEKNEAGGLTVIAHKWDGVELSRSLPAAVPEAVEGVPVTRIREGAFRNAPAIEYRIPASVTQTGSSVFDSNQHVRRVEWFCSSQMLPDFTFRQTTDLNEAVLSDSIIAIGTQAFSQSAIQRITLPKNLRWIQREAFESTKRLEDISSESLVLMDSYAFFYSGIRSFSAPHLSRVPPHAFSDTFRLETVDIRHAVAIDTGAFSNSKVEEIHVSDQLLYVAENAFEGVFKLKRIIVHGKENHEWLHSVLQGIPFCAAPEIIERKDELDP